MKSHKTHKVLFFNISFALVIFFSSSPFSSAQNLPPDHPVTLFQQGMEYRLQGDFYRALELFRTASLRNPAYFDPLFASAEVFFQLEEYDEALKMVESALRLAKTNPSARVLKARILVGMGRFQEAADIYTALLSEEPNNIDARLGKAELDIALGKNRNAAIEYLDTLKRFPDNRRALLSLGVLFMQQGNYQEAETYFDTALRYHSDSPIVHLLVGEYYFKLKKYDLAVEQAHTALSIKPDFEEAHNLLGIISFQKGEYLETYTRMDQILTLNRNNTLAWYLKALSALRLSRQEEGITLLRTLVNLAPEDEISRITLEDSLREYLPVEHALRKTYALYHFERGDKFQERNLFNRAFEEYRRGLQIDPYSVRGRLSYADILQKLGFPASSYNSLDFLKKQKSTDRTVLEQMEIAESLQADRTARRWNIDQFMQRNPSFRLSLFVDVRGSNLVHPFSELFLLQYARDILLGAPSLTVAPPLSVDSFSEAFQEARQRGTDYFLIVRFNETDREFSVAGDIYLSRTGGKIDSLSVFRTGNDRIQNALVQVTSLMKEKIPLRGELLRREFEKGLVGLGSIDGVKKGDKFYILPARSLSLKNDSFGFVFPPGDILGTFTVTDLDDLVCEGVVEKNGFFDRINPGDVLIPYIDLQAKTETGTSSTVPGPEPSLYRKILKIQ